MDGISNQIITTSTDLQTARLADNVEFYVLKESLNIQQDTAKSLLAPVAGAQPLATSGVVGTQFNAYA